MNKSTVKPKQKPWEQLFKKLENFKADSHSRIHLLQIYKFLYYFKDLIKHDFFSELDFDYFLLNIEKANCLIQNISLKLISLLITDFSFNKNKYYEEGNIELTYLFQGLSFISQYFLKASSDAQLSKGKDPMNIFTHEYLVKNSRSLISSFFYLFENLTLFSIENPELIDIFKEYRTNSKNFSIQESMINEILITAKLLIKTNDFSSLITSRRMKLLETQKEIRKIKRRYDLTQDDRDEVLNGLNLIIQELASFEEQTMFEDPFLKILVTFS
jgi:hypothetical protein